MSGLSGPKQYVVECRIIVEAWTPELAVETVIAYARPRYLRRTLLPSGGLITVEVVEAHELGPAIVLDSEILPPPESPAWRGRNYYLDDDVIKERRGQR